MAAGLISAVLFVCDPPQQAPAGNNVALHTYPAVEQAWQRGDLADAIEMLRDRQNNEGAQGKASELLQAMELQKDKLDEWIEKGRTFLSRNAIEQAQEAVSLAPSISTTYPPYKRLLADIKAQEQEQRFPPQVLFDGAGLGTAFKPYNSNGKLAELGAFTGSGLEINVPEKHGWAQVGLESVDPLAVFADTQGEGYRFTFDFNDAVTEGYRIELLPTGSQRGRVQLEYRKQDKNQASLTLFLNSIMHQQIVIPHDSRKKITLAVYPNQDCYAETADGYRVQATYYQYYSRFPVTNGYRLRISSLASKYQAATRMGLHTITLARTQQPLRINFSHLNDTDRIIPLFDGSNFARTWIPFPFLKNNQMASHTVYVHQNMLKAAIEAGKRWKNRTGICSVEPVAWLDKLNREGAGVTASAEFLPEQTNGFILAFGDNNAFWKSPGNNRMEITWRQRDTNGSPRLTVTINGKVMYDEITSMNKAATVAVRFSKGRFQLVGDGMPDQAFSWPFLQEDNGLHLWVTTLPENTEQPVAMALKSIYLQREITKERKQENNPFPPLPVKTILGPQQHDNVECFSDKQDGLACTWEKGAVVVRVSPETKQHKGIRSLEDMIVLDKRRIAGGSCRLIIHFDPQQTNHFDLSFADNHIKLQQESDGIFSFYVNAVRRQIPQQWLQQQWKGHLLLTLSKNSFHAQLDNHIGILDFTRPADQMVLAVTAHTDGKNGEPQGFALQKITRQWLFPENMDAAERWNFVDDEDFDPDAFLQELKRALP